MVKKCFACALALCLLLSLSPAYSSASANALRKITYWIQLEDATVMTNNDEGMAWRIAQEKTNVDVEFIHPAAGTGTESFNLMIASNDLPDVISYNWLSFPGGPQAALDNYVVIALNDYLAKYAPSYYAFLEAHPDAQKLVVTDDSTHFCVAGLYTWESDESKGYVSAINRPLFYEAHNGLILRKDYLDAVGREIPVTIDDWTETLRAFKNELGIESPLAPVPSTFKNSIVGAYGICNYLYQDENGITHYGPMEDAYQDYMALLAGWYTEGLLDADFAALDDTASKTKAQNGKSGAWTGYGGSWLGAFIQAALAIDPETDYYPVGAPHPVLNAGDKMAKYGQKDHPFRLGAAVTTACKDVEAALTFLDYAYSDEGDLLFNWGVENESFEWNENGLPVYTESIKNNPDRIPITTYQFLFHPKNAAIPMDQRNRLQLNLAYPTPEGYNAIVKWADSELPAGMPPYTIPTELVNEYANLGNEIKTYVDEMYMKFVMGIEPIKNFDAYRDTLRKLGVERYIEITQLALDNYNAR